MQLWRYFTHKYDFYLIDASSFVSLERHTEDAIQMCKNSSIVSHQMRKTFSIQE